MPKRGLKPVYRRPLQELHEESKGEPPSVLKESISILRQRGLHDGDLFSGCAEGRKVQLLVRAWDQGHNPLRVAKIQDCHAVAESLLQWLRSLPGPIIPCRLFRAFLRTQHASCQAESLSELHLLFQQMQDCEFQTLVQLLGLLHDYYLAQRSRGQACKPLGRIFAPLLLRPHEGPLPLPFPEDVASAADLIDYMIVDYPAVFSLQSPCSSPYHKPPSRARKGTPLKKDVILRPAKTKLNGSKCGAAVANSNENWPVKHLRVNVVAPIQDSDICCVSPEFSGFPLESSLPCDIRAPDGCLTLEECGRNDSARLATVPEGRPLAPEGPEEEADLDDVVGKLLCGSMESMLFGNNDELFMARTSSLMSMSSVNTPRNQSSCGESTDASSDDEMMHDSPCATPPRSSHISASARYTHKGPALQHWTSAQST